MKKFIVMAAIAGFLGATAPADAQTFGLGAHAGVSMPTGAYGSTDGSDAGFAKVGFSGGLDLWYPLMAVPGLNWYTSVDAIGHSLDTDAFIDPASGGYFIIPLMTGLRYDIPVGPTSIFATGQLGVVFTRPPSVDFGVGEVDGDFGTDFGFTLGAGAQITRYIYAGLKYYPLGNVEMSWGDVTREQPINFLDIYVGFGVH